MPPKSKSKNKGPTKPRSGGGGGMTSEEIMKRYATTSVPSKKIEEEEETEEIDSKSESSPASPQQEGLANGTKTEAPPATPSTTSSSKTPKSSGKQREQQSKPESKSKRGTSSSSTPASSNLPRAFTIETKIAASSPPVTTPVNPFDVCRVRLSAQSEQRLLNLLANEESPLTSDIPLNPSNMTLKQQLIFYGTLERIGFSRKQIESALQNNFGRDLGDILDWLCLNVPNADLPPGFAGSVYYQSEGSKVIFVANKLKPADTQSAVPETVSAQKEEESDEQSAILQHIREQQKKQQELQQKKEGEQKQKQQKEQQDNSKRWISQYLENMSSDEDDSIDSEEKQTIDTYAKLVVEHTKLEAKLRELRAGDRAKNAQQIENLANRLKEINVSKSQLEKSRKLSKNDPKVKAKIDEINTMKKRRKEAWMRKKKEEEEKKLQEELEKQQQEGTEAEAKQGEETKPNGSGGGEEDQGLAIDALFTAQESSEPSSSATKYIAFEDFTIPSSWKGQTPQQLLSELAYKRFPPPCMPPKFNKLPSAAGHLFEVIMHTSPSSSEKITMTTPCETANEAKNYAATMALHRFWSDQALHNLLPPAFRQLWLEWSHIDEASKLEAQDKAMQERQLFLTQLIEKNKKLRKHAASAQQAEGTAIPQPVKDEEEGKAEQKSADVIQHPALKEKKPDFSLFRMLQERKKMSAYQEMLAFRQQLPIASFKEAILNHVRRSRVLIISGETGCGKTTQVPHYILEHYLEQGLTGSCHIICTQPRRISAISVSQRVCNELGENDPSHDDSLCGYQIRLESKKGNSTQLLYCTTGILLRRLRSDPLLAGVNFIILDEVHERTVESDFLLVLLRRLMPVRTDLKLILMSATMESEKLARYFLEYAPPVVSVPGRTFPVQPFFLEDVLEMTHYTLEEDSEYAIRVPKKSKYSTTVNVSGRSGGSSQVTLQWDDRDLDIEDQTYGLNAAFIPKYCDCDEKKYSPQTQLTLARLDSQRIQYDMIEALLLQLCTHEPYQSIEGAILIFLPGIAEIQKLYHQLSAHNRFGNPRRYILLTLHSILSTANQRLAFETPPRGMRKIVLATNIAETGITIPDVVFVIDTGRVKELRYDENRSMNCLDERFVSRASAMQRRGRAGRVRDGFCFHLFSKSRFETGLMNYPQPELTRVALDELCLHIKACQLGNPAEILGEALDPPSATYIDNALQKLRFVGALDASENITSLGLHLSVLPVDVHIGKMLLFAALFSCLEPILVIAATISSTKSPFVLPIENQEQSKLAHSKFYSISSDSELIAFYQVYKEWKAAENGDAFCRKHFLNSVVLQSLDQMMDDFVSQLRQARFLQPHMSLESYSSNANQFAIVKAIICAGLYPNVLRVQRAPGATPKEYSLVENSESVYLHPSSFVHGRAIPKKFQWMVYHTKLRSSRVFIRDTTLLLPYALLLFGGPITVHHERQQVQIGEWILVNAAPKTGVVFKQLRAVLDHVLEKKITTPSLNLMQASKNLMETVLYLLQNEEKELEL